jgi:hypothetical protein
MSRGGRVWSWGLGWGVRRGEGGGIYVFLECVSPGDGSRVGLGGGGVGSAPAYSGNGLRCPAS